ncbi:MATE family efflux transporter [uncultured Chitinophaga sp.]|uniref:MATE family efflux transporter n=1 Tax=uncultured Chitinophaga sp. TaxID=339340 RepID=UPI0026359E6F|nr:MATE family efflux transporter [uncultured Chitinophaga sp.]
MQVEVSNRQIIRIAGPICLSLILPQINHLTNAAFLGHLGEFPIAVNGIAGIYTLVIYMISYGLTNGMQVMFARRTGEQNLGAMGPIFSNGLVLSMGMSFLGILITQAFAPAFFRASLHDPHIVEAASEFTQIRIWGLPFLMLMRLCTSLYIGTGNTRLLITISLFQEVTNIVFDYGLIFGKLGMPALGLNGAAWASILAEIAGFTSAWGLLLIGKFNVRYQLFERLKPDWKGCRSILIISAPLVVQYLFSIGSWLIFFIFIEHLGQRPLAISNMMRSIFGLFGIFTWALGSACNTMVSNLIGQGRESEVMPMVRKIAVLSVICSTALCVLINIFPYLWLRIYTTDITLMADAIPSMHVCTLVMLLTAVTAVVFNGVTGTGNTRVNLGIEIAAVGVYLVYCFVVIEKMRSALHWAWGAEFVYWTTMGSLAWWYLKSGRWKGKQLA